MAKASDVVATAVACSTRSSSRAAIPCQKIDSGRELEAMGRFTLQASRRARNAAMAAFRGRAVLGLLRVGAGSSQRCPRRVRGRRTPRRRRRRRRESRPRRLPREVVGGRGGVWSWTCGARGASAPATRHRSASLSCMAAYRGSVASTQCVRVSRDRFAATATLQCKAVL